jgi:hypothetical protein
MGLVGSLSRRSSSLRPGPGKAVGIDLLLGPGVDQGVAGEPVERLVGSGRCSARRASPGSSLGNSARVRAGAAFVGVHLTSRTARSGTGKASDVSSRAVPDSAEERDNSKKRLCSGSAMQSLTCSIF